MGLRDELINMTQQDDAIYNEALAIIKDNINKQADEVVEQLISDLKRKAMNKDINNGYFEARHSFNLEKPYSNFWDDKIIYNKNVQEKLCTTYFTETRRDTFKYCELKKKFLKKQHNVVTLQKEDDVYDIIFSLPLKLSISALFDKLSQIDKDCKVEMTVSGSIETRYFRYDSINEDYYSTTKTFDWKMPVDKKTEKITFNQLYDYFIKNEEENMFQYFGKVKEIHWLSVSVKIPA